MRYFILVCDYDGTIATYGRVDQLTLEALQRVRESGRKLMLVTGRELDELIEIFPEIGIFERVVAENGALIYHPETHAEKLLSERPPEEFIRALTDRGVSPLSVGRVIIATWQPHEQTVLETIRDFGLELQVIFNKGAVMVLPTGVNKASGLKAALDELGLSRHNAVGVGDAENDHAFLNLCESSVAVANALPMVKERADLVTIADHGAGVVELIDRLLKSDLKELEDRLSRYNVVIGTLADDRELSLKPYGANLMLAGSSQGGKTTLATGIIERLIEKEYQLCIIDPEGDYSELDNVVVLGDSNRPPSVDEALNVLARPVENLVINLLGITQEHRPSFFAQLYLRLQEMRAMTGRPHWIVIDETHHFLPAKWDPAPLTLPQGTFGTMMITVQPDRVAPSALSIIDTLIAIGENPEQTIALLCHAVGEEPPSIGVKNLEMGTGILWERWANSSPLWFRSLAPSGERRRHHRKYAEGELPSADHFYFTGPDGKLNLSAHNLHMFLHLGEGVDDETWLYHLRIGDYSRWFRESINDDELAEEVEQVEKRGDLSATESRALIRKAIEKRYTASV